MSQINTPQLTADDLDDPKNRDDMHVIRDAEDDAALSASHIATPEEGLTPMHRQNINESRVDEVLVEDAMNKDHYSDIRDIADSEAIDLSFDD